MIDGQPAAQALFDLLAIGIQDQRIAVGNAGPEGIAQGTREKTMQFGMKQPAGGQAVARLHQNDAPPLAAPRPNGPDIQDDKHRPGARIFSSSSPT